MPSRRDLLTSVGALTAGCLAANAFRDESNAAWADDPNNPAANVADRTSSIKLTRLTATPIARKVFIKIETNHGVTGWGEIDQLETQTAATLVRSLFELLDGENPTRIEYLWQKIYRAHRDMRGGPFMMHTLAGIDMALWDITGKLWGVPVYRLLGGPTRDKVAIYPTPKATRSAPARSRSPATPKQIERMVKHIEGAASKSARTAPSCSTPTAPCRRRC